MTSMTRTTVGFVILGACGHMGRNVRTALLHVMRELIDHDIDVHLLACVDPILVHSDLSNTTLSASSQSSHNYYSRNLVHDAIPVRGHDFSDLINWADFLTQRGIYQKIIIFDSSPTPSHYGHLVDVYNFNNNNLCYVGEKPLITHPYQIADLRQLDSNYKIFCDFIETESAILRTLKRYIASQNLVIKHMRFWRAGSSGIKKSIGAARTGVTGGALFDLSPHSFATTCTLLEPEHIHYADVYDAEIPCFCIGNSFFKNGINTFLNARNVEKSEIELDYYNNREELTADGLFAAKVRWYVRDCDLINADKIDADYLFSWVGYTGSKCEAHAHPKEQAFVHRLKELGFDRQEWLMSMTCQSAPNVENAADRPLKQDDATERHTYEEGHIEEGHIYKSYEYDDEQVRLAIFECSDRAIVCNFLPGSDNIESSSYLYAIHKGGHREKIEITFETEKSCYCSRHNQLVSLLSRVINDCTNISDAKYISRTTILQVHNVMLAAQNKAFDKLQQYGLNMHEWFEKSKWIYEERVRRNG